MSLEELLSIEPDKFNSIVFEQFINDKGLGKVTKNELDKIVDTFGIRVFYNTNFDNVYGLVNTDDTNRSMKFWTKAIGVMTIFILLMTDVHDLLYDVNHRILTELLICTLYEGAFLMPKRRDIMAKRTRIELTLFQCPICKKKYFSYQARMCCPECTKEKEESDGAK